MASTRKPVGINFDKMLLSLKDDIQGMVEDYEEMNLPINDDSEKLRRFCERLEFLLKFGLKERSLVLGGRKDLWPYLCRCLEERRNIQDGITLVKANKELKTNSGRHRYFLRYCLLQRCLADVLQQCVADEASTLQFYDTGSLLLQPHFASDLVTSLYVLSDLTFDLALASSGHDLDVCWPAYARVGGASPWSRPPSRTWSLSSLCSSSSMAGSLAPAGDATLPSSPRKSPGSSMASPSSPVTSSSSFAAADDDVVVGVVGNDVMVGGAGNDVIVGGAGNDVIVGGVRSDVMVSGVGSDVMVGGVGNVDLITSLRENLAFLESDNAYLRQRLLKAGSPVRQREGERGGEEEEEAIKEGGERGEEEKGEKERENEKKGEKEREEGCQRCQRLLSEREMLADQIAQLEIQLEKLTKEGGKKEEERREGREEETKGEEEKEGKESKEDEEGRREVKREEEEEEKENESEEGRREEKRTQVTRTEEREVTRAEERTQTNPRASDSGRSLEIQIIEMERKLNKKVALLSQREKDCSALKDDLESLREKYEERENGLRIANEMVAQAAELKNAHKELNAEYGQLKKEEISIREEMRKMREEMERTKAEREEEQEERQQKAASRISSLEGDRRRLEVALEAREREGEERREKEEREREKREEEERERGRLQEEERKRTECIENEKLDLLEENVKLREENGNLREENGNLREENGNLYKENGNLREENGNLREENGNLKEEKANLREENGNLIVENGNLKEENGNLIEENGNLKEENGNLIEENGNLWKENGNLVEENGNLKEENGNLCKENGNLKEENGNLREKIIQLLREKDSLWHSNQRLEEVATWQRRAATGGAEWQRDATASACMLCGTAFTLLRRRHHCRHCGRIFCSGCVDNWILTEAESRRVRVCDECFSVQAELASLVASLPSRWRSRTEGEAGWLPPPPSSHTSSSSPSAAPRV